VFAFGETVLLHEVWRDRLWSAAPMIVVQDTPELVVMWRPRGTVRKVPATPPTRPRPEHRWDRLRMLMSECDWVLEDQAWDVDNLWLMRPGDWSSVWVSWLASGAHWGWYLNLQTPYARTATGFRMMDMMLDVVVANDRSWEWKDEKDFQAIIDHGLIDEAAATAVRTEAARLIGDLEADRAPFCDGWEDWRPDPAWAIPMLPVKWGL